VDDIFPFCLIIFTFTPADFSSGVAIRCTRQTELKMHNPTSIPTSIQKIIVSAIVAASSWPVAVSAQPNAAAPSAGTSPATTTASASPVSSFDQRMHNLESQMDAIFTDTFHNAGNWFRGSKFASSVDLREEKDNYVVRLYLPDTDTSKVNARIDNNALHITTANEQAGKEHGQAQPYEEIIGLPGPVQSAKMQIQRKQNLVVITVPKTESSIASSSPNSTAKPAGSPAGNAADWDQSMINEMARMQGRMDQLSRDLFPDNWTQGSSDQWLGSAVNVDDQKNKYVVHFYLPDRDLSNVNVKLENGRLDLTAKEEKKADQRTAGTNFHDYESGNFEEMISLPGPVKQNGMTVDRRDGTVVVTVPKA
jgi:HSP20 family molecular chaperone IbpA